MQALLRLMPVRSSQHAPCLLLSSRLASQPRTHEPTRVTAAFSASPYSLPLPCPAAAAAAAARRRAARKRMWRCQAACRRRALACRRCCVSAARRASHTASAARRRARRRCHASQMRVAAAARCVSVAQVARSRARRAGLISGDGASAMLHDSVASAARMAHGVRCADGGAGVGGSEGAAAGIAMVGARSLLFRSWLRVLCR